MHPIYIQPQRWVIQILWNIDLSYSLQTPNLTREVLRNLIVLAHVRAADLHVDWRGHTHVEDGIDHRSAREKCANVRILFVQLASNSIHVPETALTVIVVESDLDRRRVRPCIRRVQRREIRYHSDI